MVCPQCQGAERVFSDRVARRELRRYQRKGPAKTTRLLLDMIPADAAKGGSLLDVGGGIGAIQHELAAKGIARATDVDASKAYLEVARQESERRGYAGRARFVHGDFVDLAPDLERADVVTMDRVVCCYPDARRLLTSAADRAGTYLGLVWPRDRWWAGFAGALINALMRLSRNPFRFHRHPDAVVADALEGAGFTRRTRRLAGFWQVALYERVRSGVRPQPKERNVPPRSPRP